MNRRDGFDFSGCKTFEEAVERARAFFEHHAIDCALTFPPDWRDDALVANLEVLERHTMPQVVRFLRTLNFIH
jgi:hypothetical protein